MHAHHVPPPLAGSTSARGVGSGRGSGEIAESKQVAIYHAEQQHKAALQDADAKKELVTANTNQRVHQYLTLVLHTQAKHMLCKCNSLELHVQHALI